MRLASLRIPADMLQDLREDTISEPSETIKVSSPTPIAPITEPVVPIQSDPS
jgi:hypothetical protein